MEISFMHKSKLLWQAEEEKSPEFLPHTSPPPSPPPKIAMDALFVVPYTALIYPLTLRHFHSPGEKFSQNRVLQWCLHLC